MVPRVPPTTDDLHDCDCSGVSDWLMILLCQRSVSLASGSSGVGRLMQMHDCQVHGVRPTRLFSRNADVNAVNKQELQVRRRSRSLGTRRALPCAVLGWQGACRGATGSVDPLCAVVSPAHPTLGDDCMVFGTLRKSFEGNTACLSMGRT